MKTKLKLMVLIAVGVLVALRSLAGPPADIVLGDTQAKVMQVLGNPIGCVRGGHFTALLYDRGTVELRDGKVTVIRLITREQADLKRAANVKRDAERARVSAMRRIEGEQVLKAKLAEQAFLGLSAGQQLAYWKGFLTLYPEVNISALLADAQERVDAESQMASAQANLAVTQNTAPQSPSGTGGYSPGYLETTYATPYYYGYVLPLAFPVVTPFCKRPLSVVPRCEVRQRHECIEHQFGSFGGKRAVRTVRAGFSGTSGRHVASLHRTR